MTDFLGCLYAGRIPVPVQSNLGSRGSALIRRIIADCEAEAVLAEPGERGRRLAVLAGLPSVQRTDQFFEDAVIQAAPSDIAFLQYTSGSTSDPKGVVVTHRNLRSNLDSITRTFQHTADTRILSWLPMFHDMGLVGNVLHALDLGCHLFLSSPRDFILDPLSWLKSISRHQIDTAGGPNFGFQLVNLALEERGVPQGIDLDGWRLAYCGAEPIDVSVHQEFARRLGPIGFDASALTACYGLAEATLLVSAGPLSLTPSGVGSRGRTVSSGTPRDCDVRIDGGSGEGRILVRGDSVSPGYWPLPSDRDTGPADWTDTGDVGLLRQGDLFITGRSRDILNVRGRNVHSVDVEDAAMDAVPALRGSVLSAVLSEDGVLSIISETQEELTHKNVLALSQVVADEFGSTFGGVYRSRRGGIPRTTSGKVQRFECQRRFEQGLYTKVETLSEPGEMNKEPAPAETEGAARVVEQILRELSGVDSVKWDEPLTSHGIDSVTTIRIAHALEQRLGIRLEMEDLFRAPNVRQIAAAAASSTHQGGQSGTQKHDPQASKAQEGLVFLSAMHPDSDEYNLECVFELSSDTDVTRLCRSVRETFARHGELSTTLQIVNESVQRSPVSAETLKAALRLEPVDISGRGLSSALAESRAEPFDLQTGPLFRTTLLTDGKITYLQFVVHHAICDMWSLALLLREIGIRYSGGIVPGSSSEPPPSYDQYVLAQKSALDDPKNIEWAEKVSHRVPRRPGPLGLRTDRPRSHRRAVTRQRVTLDVSAAQMEELHQRGAMATLSAIWGLCLSRYSGDELIALGAPVAGRPTAGLSEIVGLCTNTTVLIVEHDPATSINALVADVRNQIASALDASLIPLSEIVDRVKPARVPGRSPVLETFVTVLENPYSDVRGLEAVLHGLEPEELQVGELRMKGQLLTTKHTRVDLDLVLSARETGGSLTLDYPEELFDRGTIERILGTLLAMIDVVREKAEATVADLDVISTEDLDLLAVAGDDLTREMPVGPGGLVHAVADTAPELAAVIEPGRTTRFDDLARIIENLSARIQRAKRDGTGLGKASDVGLLLPSSMEFTAAIFAAWRVGCGFVPLPVEYPVQRLAHMLKGAAADVVVTLPEFVGLARSVQAEAGQPAAILSFEADATSDQTFLVGNNSASADAAAYTVFTSGSTGVPKGVRVSQSNLSPMIRWFGERFKMKPGMRMAQTLSLAFDFGIQEIFTSIPFGATVVIPKPEERSSPQRYAQFLARSEINVLYTTPSFAEALAAAGVPLPALRICLLGGEVLTAKAVRAVRRVVPSTCRLFNGYGPTEATINSLVYEIPASMADQDLPSILPVGRATSGDWVRVVDDSESRPLPVGAVGELLIGGRGIASGYIGRNSETAERFVQAKSPLTGRMEPAYRTGDLGYVDHSGNFIVLGRTDRQVKIGGFRVELGEIEAAADRFATVHRSSAQVIGSPPRLVLFAVHSGSLEPIRAAMERTLPSHMHPSQYVTMDDIPLTINGKADIVLLAQIADKDFLPGVPDQATVRDILDAVLNVWQKLLDGPTNVRATENVFDQGAHSLLVLRAHGMLQSALSIEFPVHLLFEFPQPLALAERLHNERTQR